MHEESRRQSEHGRRDKAERPFRVGQRPGDAGEHFFVAANRREAAARADTGRDQDFDIRIVGRVGRTERAQQFDAVARADHR
jgi:hypothetical protein